MRVNMFAGARRIALRPATPKGRPYMRKSVAAAIVTALGAMSAAAGQVESAGMTSSAQMQVSNGALDGCGLRVVAVAHFDTARMTTVDFSFNLYRSGLSLVKAGVRMGRMRSDEEAPPIKTISSFWIRTVGETATTPDKRGIGKSQSPKGYLLYGTSATTVTQLFSAAFDGRPLQVGFRVLGEDVDQIFSGTIKETGSEFGEAKQCIRELAIAMKKDGEEETRLGQK